MKKHSDPTFPIDIIQFFLKFLLIAGDHLQIFALGFPNISHLANFPLLLLSDISVNFPAHVQLIDSLQIF